MCSFFWAFLHKWVPEPPPPVLLLVTALSGQCLLTRKMYIFRTWLPSGTFDALTPFLQGDGTLASKAVHLLHVNYYAVILVQVSLCIYLYLYFLKCTKRVHILSTLELNWWPLEFNIDEYLAYVVQSGVTSGVAMTLYQLWCGWQSTGFNFSQLQILILIAGNCWVYDSWWKDSLSKDSLQMGQLAEGLYVEVTKFEVCKVLGWKEICHFHRLNFLRTKSCHLLKSINQILPTLKNDMRLHYCEVSVNILKKVRWVHSTMNLSTKSRTQSCFRWRTFHPVLCCQFYFNYLLHGSDQLHKRSVWKASFTKDLTWWWG